MRLEGKNYCFVVSIFVLLMPLASVQANDSLLGRIPQVFERAEDQYRALTASVTDRSKLPRTIRPDGSLLTVSPEDWTSGFFPGCLWLLHEFNGAAEWKEKAQDYTRRVERIRHFKGHHDTGFMLGCSYGNALRLAPNAETRQILRDGASALATRFDPRLGLIRSWDDKAFTFPVIIDNMMNLELLTWAARNGGDPKLREIALSHADKTLQQHFRPDGSAYHIVDYDPSNGWVRAIHGGQGADVRTPWARGQGWAIYGFTMMYRETEKVEYLNLAKNLADFLIAHPNMPANGIPNWDYGLTEDEAVPRDASAAAIMASALLELGQVAPDGDRFIEFARKQLLSLSSPDFLADAGTNGGFLLKHSTGHFPVKNEVDKPLIYADYYFLEALLRYRSIKTNTSRKSFGAS